MRGSQVYSLPVPVAGLITNQSPQNVPPEAVVDGENMFIDIDNFFKPRPGYEPMAVTGPGGWIIGGIQFRDGNSVTTWTVVANLSQWWVNPASTTPITWLTWVDPTVTWPSIPPAYTMWSTIPLSTVATNWQNITGTPNTATTNCQARFVAFYMGTSVQVFGVDRVDPMRRWMVGDATYSTVLAAPIGARDITVVNARIMVCNLPARPFRVQWSAVNDGETWPGTAFADLVDTDEALVAIRNFGRTAAAIYGQRSIWLAIAQSGSDATAFQFQQIPSVISGPVSPSAVVDAEGIHFFFGRDLRLHRFDGTQVSTISQQLDPTLVRDVNQITQNEIHGVFVSRLRSILWFYPIGINEAPTRGILLNIDSGRIDPVWAFGENITASFFGGEFAGGVTWLNWVSATATWPDVPYATWSEIPAPFSTLFAVIGTSTGQVHNFGTVPTDNGVPIDYFWKTALFRQDPLTNSKLERINIFWNHVSTSETVKVEFNSLVYPTAEADLIDVELSDVANDDTYELEISPSNTAKAMPYAQVRFSGTSVNGVVAYGGAELFYDPEVRG